MEARRAYLSRREAGLRREKTSLEEQITIAEKAMVSALIGFCVCLTFLILALFAFMGD